MKQNKNYSIGIIFFNALNCKFPIFHALLISLFGLINVKYIYDNLHILEQGLPLKHKIIVHKSVLTSAVPKIEG